MEFTYKDYALLIEKIREAGYKFADYENYDEFDKSLILRHDVDYNIQKTIFGSRNTTSYHDKNSPTDINIYKWCIS